MLFSPKGTSNRFSIFVPREALNTTQRTDGNNTPKEKSYVLFKNSLENCFLKETAFVLGSASEMQETALDGEMQDKMNHMPAQVSTTPIRFYNQRVLQFFFPWDHHIFSSEKKSVGNNCYVSLFLFFTLLQ